MSRQSIRTRPSRSLSALIVALIILCLGLALTIAAASAVAQQVWPAGVVRSADAIPAFALTDVLGWAIAAIAVILGLILLWLAIAPGRRRAHGLRPSDDDDSVEVLVTSAAIEHMARTEAMTVDGITHAKADLHGRSLRVAATTPIRENGALAQDVRQVLDERFAGIPFARNLKITASVQSKESG